MPVVSFGGKNNTSSITAQLLSSKILLVKKNGHEQADVYPNAGIFSGPNWISEVEQRLFFFFSFLMASLHSYYTTERAHTGRRQ